MKIGTLVRYRRTDEVGIIIHTRRQPFYHVMWVSTLLWSCIHKNELEEICK